MLYVEVCHFPVLTQLIKLYTLLRLALTPINVTVTKAGAVFLLGGKQPARHMQKEQLGSEKVK